MKVVSKEQMNKIDKDMSEIYGLPSLLLMEHAAEAVADTIVGSWPGKDCCLVCAGSGNNGGDAIAVARILAMRGWEVDIAFLGDPEALGCDSAMMMATVVKYIEDGRIGWIDNIQDLIEVEEYYDLCVDGLFGTGCTRPIEGDLKMLIEWINKSDMQVVSIDIPSGVRANDGSICGLAIKADLTVGLGLPKPGNLLYPGSLYNGVFITKDIGLEADCISGAGHVMETIDEDVLDRIPVSERRSHKYTYGRVLIIAGSENMPGAAALTALAAYKTGSGLVEVVVEKGGRDTVLSLIPEAIATTYEKSDRFEASLEAIRKRIDKSDAILIGPGCGVDGYTERLLEMALAQNRVPVVIDADALTVIAGRRELLTARKAEVIITPHHGEMARLTGSSSDAIGEDSGRFAKEFSMENDVITILKSDRTLVGMPDGLVYINTSGSPSLATAGSGDVLAGMVVSLLGQGLSSADAATVAVYCHGLCGELAGEGAGGKGVMARDIATLIPASMEGHQ